MGEGRAHPVTDHDLLMRLDERTRKIHTCMTNHLSEHVRREDWHRRLVLVAFGAGLAGLTTAVVSLIAWACTLGH